MLVLDLSQAAFTSRLKVSSYRFRSHALLVGGVACRCLQLSSYYNCGKSSFFCLPALVVGLERASYTVSESEEAVEICITAVGATTPCLGTQSFQVTLSTTEESAGILLIYAQL